jgi:hypothetical protein
MPMGTRHRLSGLLLQSPRGLLLQVDDGGTYVLETSNSAKSLLGHRVTVEGTRCGFDRLDVEWLGPAQPR